MRVLDLFSGIGGFSLGLERAGMETVAFCEIDDYCRRVLKKHWPDIPIYEDICFLEGDECGPVDLICGGYPCQPFSASGKRGGAEDDRHLWPEMLRVIRAVNPKYVICENVFGHVHLGLDDVLSDLEAAGYTWETFVIPACGVGAPHRRDRAWVVAYAEGERLEEWWERSGKDRAQDSEAAKAGSNRSSGCGLSSERGTVGQWASEPGVGRVVNGLSSRMDRLRSLGNAVVPQIPEILGRAIMKVERECQISNDRQGATAAR